jgi:alkylation response protein AidB-like acyl-CoA dehydrogenase
MTTKNALDAANDLRNLILENRDETESGRQLARPVVEGLIRSKLGLMALPAEFDGLAVPPVAALAVFEALAEAEASVAWIVWNSSLPCWFARFLDADARQQIFGGRHALFASSTRPSGRATKDGDNYFVSGRWSLVSGCMHAEWIPVMCMVEDGGKIEMLAPDVPHARMIFVPRDAHEIVDTWHVGGLRGTGSHDCVLDDVSVPASHSFALGAPSLMDSPLGRMPIAPTMAAGCASICLGIATTSLRALMELAMDKAASEVTGGPSLRDRPVVQSLVARAETKIEALRARLRATCDVLWNKAEAGEERSNTDLGAAFGAAITTALECRAIVTEIYAAAGASSLYTDSPIERAHRDIHAVAQHIVLQPFWLEQAGRVALGLDPTNPLFLL